jgi:regulator of sigma E protease
MPELARAAIALPIIFAVAGLLLLVHELGHYIAARACRRPVRIVAIGFGPKLIERLDRHGTTWRLALVPIGGYVALRPESAPADSPSFRAGPVVIRLVVTAAGPAANLILAIILYAGLAWATGEISFRPVASSIEPGSPAAIVGFQPGDRITSADGMPVARFEDLRPILETHPNREVRFDVMRNAAALTLTTTLAARNQDGRTIGHLGIWSHDTQIQSVGAGEAILLGVQRSWQGAVATLADLARAVRTAGSPNPLATAIDVAGLKGPAAAPGLVALIALTAFLSVGLALTNLLPMPMLDGGAILVALTELIRRRPTSPAALAFANRAGAAVLASMFAAASLHGLFAH